MVHAPLPSGIVLSLALAAPLAAVAQTTEQDETVQDPQVGAQAEPTEDRPPLPSAARLRPDQPVPAAELEAFVDGVVRHAMAADRLVGVSVSVVQGGRDLLEKGYGFADLEGRRPVDPAGTLFRIGSITKTFTWIAVMKAVERGHLGLDDPVNDHLPPDLLVPDQAFDEPIRIRHLMTHTPGFEDTALGHLFVRDAVELRSGNDYLREERPARVREPGAFSTYSNYGVALAGAILERIHGEPWQDIVETEILRPLGMTHTSTREPHPPRDDLPAPMDEQLANDLARGYRWAGTHHEQRAFEFITHTAPAGAMSSTASDMSLYMRMLLNDGVLDGVRVFGAEAARAFRTPMTRLPPVAGNWAGGFWVMPLPGGFTNYGHDGATLSFFSSMVLVPELELGVFVATNTAGGMALSGALAGRIVEHFYAQPAAGPEPMQPDLAGLAVAYEGVYLQTRRAYSGLEGFLFRLLQSPVQVTPDGYLALGLLGEVQRFVPGERPGEFRAADEGLLPGIVFRDENGRPVRIETLAVAFEPVGALYRLSTLGLLGAAALIASFGTLLGARVRAGRPTQRTAAQGLAGKLQVSAAVAWMVAAFALVWLAVRVAPDQAELLYGWPLPSVLVFSSVALVAALLSGAAALLLPAVWVPRGGAAGWPFWRKLRFTMATLVFVGLGALLGLWGALQPWNP